jgi:spermidine synthase
MASERVLMIKVEEVESDFGTINIFRSISTGTLIYEQGGCSQSSADGNGTSVASYIHAIFGLLIQAKARDILLIGGGGGTLGTMLAHARRKTTIVDVNPASFRLAKQYFGLPDSVVCHVADGKHFLRNEAATYDAVVLDAFHGDCIPSHLQSARFFELVREHLTPRGAVFANVCVKHDFDDYADRIAKTMRGAWTDVRLLDAVGIHGRNAIVMAGLVSHLRAPDLLVRPQTKADKIDYELARLRFRAWRVSRLAFGFG